MKVKVALVTNKKNHHKYWISEMMKSNNVVCIIHPISKGNRLPISLKAISKENFFFSILLMILNKLFFIFSKNNSRSEFVRESKKWFPNASSEYDKIDKEIIHEVETVNSPEAISIIKNLKIDIVCFLGGDIAKADFINSAQKISLNYHSGLSPIYNGTKSYLWPMVENRPNLIGGTLMRINERIDGGDIISQFLPSISKNDNASSLFMKSVDGAVELYNKAIKKIEKNEELCSVHQERSIRYTRSSDWSFYHELQLSKFYKSGKISRYVRESFIIEAENGDEILIQDLLKKTLKKK